MTMMQELNALKKKLSIARKKQSAIIGIALLAAIILSIFILPFIAGMLGNFNGFLVYYALLFILAFTVIIKLAEIEMQVKEIRKEINEIIEKM